MLSKVGDILESLPYLLQLTYLLLYRKARLAVPDLTYSIARLLEFKLLLQLRAASALNQALASPSKPALR
jgi:hypothetical protein